MEALEWVQTPCGESSHCVDVAMQGEYVFLRNGTDGMRISRGEWDAFTAAVKADVFDADR